MRLSVLDLVPVRTDQTTSDALAATTHLAQTADRLGYTRYWLAEHHNMPAVAATSPPVLIALSGRADVAAAAGLGRGDAAQPRAAGGRRAVRAAGGRAPRPHRPRHRPRPGLRSGDLDGACAARPAATTATSRRFPQYLDDVVALMSARGVRVPLPRDLMRRELRPQGDACGGDRAAAVAARLVDVLGAPGRGQGAAVRVRPPLLGAGHRGGARGVSLGVPAE